MATSLFAFSALFCAVMLMMTGIGLLGTTLSLRLTLENVPVQVIGIIMSAYFVGMVLGRAFSATVWRSAGCLPVL